MPKELIAVTMRKSVCQSSFVLSRQAWRPLLNCQNCELLPQGACGVRTSQKSTSYRWVQIPWVRCRSLPDEEVGVEFLTQVLRVNWC